MCVFEICASGRSCVILEQFLDGLDADSAEIGQFCGTSTPPPFMSTGNVMRVEFRSDYSSSGQGFLFQWVATSDQVPSTTPAPGSTTPGMKKIICSSKLISQNFVHSPMKCPSTRVIDVWRRVWPTGVVKEYSKIKELNFFWSAEFWYWKLSF